mgnify:CR=1 FL=1|nr:sensor histidine kinase [uncultured Blautia sp.]
MKNKKKKFKIIKDIYKNRTLKTKILEGYIVIIVLVILLIAVLLSCFLHNYINENIYLNMQNHNQRVEKALKYHFDDIIKLSEYPYTDGEVLGILRKNYESGGSEEIEKMNDNSRLSTLLYKHVFYMNEYIESVWLVPANKKITPAVKTIRSVNNNYDITMEDWYQEVLEGKGNAFILGVHHDNGTNNGSDIVSVARSIIDPENGADLGMIVINMPVQKIASLCYTNDAEGIVTAVADEKNKFIIYKKSDRKQEFNKYLTYHADEIKSDKMTKIKISGENYYIVASEFEMINGRIFQMYSEERALKSFQVFVWGIVAGAIVIGVILFVISYSISKSITKPINQLVDSMRAVEKGNLKEKSEDFYGELKILSDTFNQMTEKMSEMFYELQEKERQKRKMELLALQAQINPHFMYNTLNSIKCMAELQGADSVVKMLDAMVFVLRYTAEDTQEIVSIEREIEFIKNYTEIINFRYFGRFSFIFHVPSETLSYGTLRFILQPILENAVFHGFEPQDLNAVIELRVIENEDTIVFEITDTGKGIEPQRCKEILEQESKEKRGLNKIGIYNVDQRIKLTFGKQYGIKLVSRVQCFTKAIITIPKINIFCQEDEEKQYEKKGIDC